MKKVGWRSTIDSPEKIRCFGCETFNDPCEYGIRECCIDKRINNCGECDKYPCDNIKTAFEITNVNIERFKDLLSSEEYEIFTKAFFQKKENLDKVWNQSKV